VSTFIEGDTIFVADGDPLVAGADPRGDALEPFSTYHEHTRDLLLRSNRMRRRWIVPRGLLIADLVGLTVSYGLATLIWQGPGHFTLFALTLPCWVLIANLHGLYHSDERRVDHSTTDEVVSVFQLVTLGVWMLFVISRVAGYETPGAYKLITFWLLGACLVPVARVLARETCRRNRAYQQNTVIVGAGDIGQLVGRKLIKHPEYGLNVVGFVDRSPKARRADLPDHLTILGGPERLPEVVEQFDVERVMIAFTNERVPELLSILRQLRGTDVQIDLVPRLFELVGPRVVLHTVEGLPLVGLPAVRLTPAARAVKRAIDVLGASLALVALAPVMAFIAIRIKRDSPGPVLFRQRRLGAGMTEFTLLKFRTMETDTDSTAHRLYVREMMAAGVGATSGSNGIYKLDHPGVTRLARWLRRTSLDELPQLFNVLRGEMSLVGPRPCIPYETEDYEPHHFERFLMPQGLTGLWQVTARANSSYGEALDMDVAYVRGWSLGLDLRLLLRTPLSVIRQRSATA
jgi:exopolysaccharide biosynthesis polyprenyl glycosylphosphotransferase